MRKHYFVLTAFCAAAVRAGLALAAPLDCAEPDQATAARCAWRNHPAVAIAAADVRMSVARAQLARLAVPSPPQVGATAGPRLADRAEFSWSVAVTQEIELGNQRESRVRGAESALAANQWRAQATRRHVAAVALAAYFEALTARDLVVLAQWAVAVAEDNARAAKARAGATLAPALAADIAEFAAVGARQESIAAEQRYRVARIALGTLIGHPAPVPAGELLPLPAPATATADRPEIVAFQAELAGQAAQAETLRRARTPNVSVGVFAQRGAANETTIGVALNAALPVARRIDGELAEQVAALAKVEVGLAAAQREQVQERAASLEVWQQRSRAAAAYTGDSIARARQLLLAMATQIRAGELGIRDGVTAQQALLAHLQAAVRAKGELCQASVALALAHGAKLAAEDP